jgi:hypothetical protein
VIWLRDCGDSLWYRAMRLLGRFVQSHFQGNPCARATTVAAFDLSNRGASSLSTYDACDCRMTLRSVFERIVRLAL